MSDFIQVVTTTETYEDARKIAEKSIHGKKAACAQIIGPIKSIFHWKGKFEEAEEYVCTLKTLKTAFSSLEKTIREHHPYEVPEIITLTITDGSDDYLSWMRREVEAKS